MKSLPWLRILCSLVCGGLALFFLWHAPWLRPRAVIENCLDDEFEFSPDSRRLVVWTGWKVYVSSKLHLNELGIRSHDVATGMKICTFENSDEGFAENVIFSPDCRFAANVAIQKVFVWEAATGRRATPTIPVGAWPPSRCFFSPDAELLCDAKGITTRVRDGKTIADFRHMIGDVQWIAVGPESLAAYAAVEDVRVIDRGRGQMLHAFPLPDGKNLTNQRLWAGGKILTVYRLTLYPFVQTAPQHPECFIWMAPGQESARWDRLDSVESFEISPDGQWLAYSQPVTQWTWIDRVFADWFHRPLERAVLRIDRLQDGENDTSIRNGLNARFSPDGRTLAVSFADGRIGLWDFPLRKPTLLIVLLSVLVSVSVYTGSRWWQQRRRAKRPAD